MNQNFWQGKRVFVTGHTGFKGSWLCLWLQSMGAHVTGYSLAPETTPNIFTLAKVADGMTSIIGDINDGDAIKKAVHENAPDIVLHLAAQALVRLSYDEPVKTFATNVMGTINVLEAIRQQPTIRAAVIITTDKCYENREWIWSYRENEALGGRDPYSASKACTEIVTAAYRDSFFRKQGVAMASVRAGNVIGGGDWAKDRLVPDILKALENGGDMLVRNPDSTRPWQHVLEPLNGYLTLAENLFTHGEKFASAWNFGPSANDVRPVKWIIDRLAQHYGTKLECKQMPGNHPHEAHFLSLDSAKAHSQLDWQPQWSLDTALMHIASWHKAWLNGDDMHRFTLNQISSYSNTPHQMELKTNVK